VKVGPFRPRGEPISPEFCARFPGAAPPLLVCKKRHPDGLSAGSQGNAQALDNGNTFVGWGQTGRFSEFDPSGNLLFDAGVPAGYDTYRAYRHVWHARPDSPPTATARRNGDGTTTVHALWNGATDVARWVVVGGAHPHRLRRLGAGAWNGLDTTITVPDDGSAQLAVVAEDAAGRTIERSPIIAPAD
jgi:hypothetical protein